MEASNRSQIPRKLFVETIKDEGVIDITGDKGVTNITRDESLTTIGGDDDEIEICVDKGNTKHGGYDGITQIGGNNLDEVDEGRDDHGEIIWMMTERLVKMIRQEMKVVERKLQIMEDIKEMEIAEKVMGMTLVLRRTWYLQC